MGQWSLLQFLISEIQVEIRIQVQEQVETEYHIILYHKVYTNLMQDRISTKRISIHPLYHVVRRHELQATFLHFLSFNLLDSPSLHNETNFTLVWIYAVYGPLHLKQPWRRQQIIISLFIFQFFIRGSAVEMYQER